MQTPVHVNSRADRAQCNEAHPQCANCIRLAIECTWPRPPAVPPQSNGPERHASSTPSDHPSSVSVPPSASPPLAIDDLRLLHHWHTAFSFLHADSLYPTQTVWSVDAIDVAFEHPFLLHGLLAVSALHKTLSSPQTNRPGLLVQAESHMASALAVYRTNLETPSLETALPMFLMASALFAYNLASAQIEEPEDPIDAVLHCFRLLRYIREVSGAHWQELSKTTIVTQLLSGVTDVHALPMAEDSSRFRPVLDLRQVAEELPAPDKEVCIEAIENLHQTFLKTELSSDDRHAVNIFMTW